MQPSEHALDEDDYLNDGKAILKRDISCFSALSQRKQTMNKNKSKSIFEDQFIKNSSRTKSFVPETKPVLDKSIALSKSDMSFGSRTVS